MPPIESAPKPANGLPPAHSHRASGQDGPTPLAVGDILVGRYLLEARHDGGAMGAIWLGRQLSMDRRVAVKVLPTAMVGDPDRFQQFKNEARALSRLNHPSIVMPLDYGVDDASGVPFLVMEFVEGDALDRVLERGGPMNERRAIGMLLQLCRALTEAHHHGIIHRDLKPANMRLTELSDGRERLKILDFGIAQLEGEVGFGNGFPTAVVGTPEFMSPEQARGGRVDERTDLYAIGCILHTMLTGRPPYTGDNALDVLMAHIEAPVPELPVRLPTGLAPSEGICGLYAALMAKKPEDRPTSALDLVKVLEQVDRGLDLGGGPNARPRMVRPTTQIIRAALGLPEDGYAPPQTIPLAIEPPPIQMPQMVPDQTRPVRRVVTGKVSRPAQGRRTATQSSIFVLAQPPQRTNGWGAPAWLALFVMLGAVGTVAGLWMNRAPVGAVPLAPTLAQRTVAATVHDDVPPAATTLRPEVIARRRGAGTINRAAAAPAPVARVRPELPLEDQPALMGPHRVVDILSEPLGASVFDGTIKVGVTPMRYSLAKSKAARELRVALPGYESSTVRLTWKGSLRRQVRMKSVTP